MADYPVSIDLVRRKLLEMRDGMEPAASAVLNMALTKLEGFPAMDVEQVVRCRKCIYGSKRCDSEYHLGCAYWAQIVRVDGYCSNGVKESKYIGNGEGHSQRTW